MIMKMISITFLTKFLSMIKRPIFKNNNFMNVLAKDVGSTLNQIVNLIEKKRILKKQK